MNNNVVCVVALTKADRIVACTSCDKTEAQKYAKYYRSIGYNAKVLTYEELEVFTN